MPDARKKPCRICRRWFRPDPRIGDRQRACSRAECQAVRRQKTQAGWRDRNPSYGAAYRIDQRHPPDPEPAPEPLVAPAPLDKLPWDVAKDEFGGKGADFIGVIGTLLLRAAKDQFEAYLLDPRRLSGTLPDSGEKTRSSLGHTGTRAASNEPTAGISSTGPPPGTPKGTPPGAPTAPARFVG